MKRDPERLAADPFDLVVVGGGIYGACVARDAALRGLRVALVEQGDFGQGTSANSLKTVHGGLRYLQHADFRRMRESIRERSIWLRTAPHLVRPFPFLMPTYGHGMRGREAMALALAMNELVSLDRNRGLNAVLPRGRMLSRAACLERAPGIPEAGLNGAALWYDGILHDSERLVWAIVRSAADAGAEVANYVRAESIRLDGRRVAGLRVRDVVSGDELPIATSRIVTAVGPWAPPLCERFEPGATGWVKALNVVTRPLGPRCGLGVAAAPGRRLHFLLPWQGCTLIGTAYFRASGSPGELRVEEAELSAFLAEVHEAYPGARLGLGDVRLVHCGLLPARGGDPLALETSPRIVDGRSAGAEGLFSVTGVKYTTARAVAEATVDRVVRSLGREAPACRTAEAPVAGGGSGAIEELLRQARAEAPGMAGLEGLVTRHGTAFADVLGCRRESDPDVDPVSEVSAAELRHAARFEMVAHLTDAISRRTPIATTRHPGAAVLRSAAAIVGGELGWDEARVDREISLADGYLRHERHARPEAV